MRLIDADALMLEPKQGVMNGILFAGRSTGKTLAQVQNALRIMIDNAPTIEAEPVRHGRWKQYKNDSGFCWPLDICCSECGSQYTFCKNPNYCPNCGAKMDEEVEE